MPWPIPTAKAIAARFAGTLEAGLQKARPLVDALAISRSVRSARGVLAQIGRGIALELRQAHDHISWWAAQWFPDTAEEEFTLRHANIWGVQRRAATRAIGAVTIEGVAGTVVPAETELAAADGTKFTTDELATIDGGGSIEVALTAVEAGLNGNIEASVQLGTILPFPEISKVTITAAGMAGGADIETYASVQAATLTQIRERAHGGAGFDYPYWLGREFSVEAVRTLPDWIGHGSVGVVAVMKVENDFGRAPTQDELDAMLVYLGPPGSDTGVRPVTAHVVVLAGVVTPIDISVRVRPDTAEVRAAVTEAYSRFIATLGDVDDPVNAGPISATIEPSRISEAISAASGEYAHDLTVPAAPTTLGNSAYPTPGTITFLDPQ